MKLHALDMCCSAGGVTRGLLNAGFDVWGIDIKDQAHYPGEAMFTVGDLRSTWVPWVRRNFNFLWLSPPCQFASEITPDKSKHINLIPAARKLAKASKLPYVIENVYGARQHLRNPICLTGTMFNLGAKVDGVYYQLSRERYFESNFPIPIPRERHDPLSPVVGVYGGHARCRSKKFGGRGTRDFIGHSQRKIAAEAMGIDWMTLGEMSEAIPPAMAEHIGRAAIRHIRLTDKTTGV